MKWRFLLGLFFLYPIARILLRLRVIGRENIPKRGVIIAANHTSNFDPPLLVLATKRELYFLAKEELFNVSRFFSWLIKSFNARPLPRERFPKSLLLEIKGLLDKGKTVLLFPEGTRSRNGKLKEFKPGIGFLAQFTNAPVVPCFVKGVKDSIISLLVDRDLVKSGLRNSRAWPKIEVRFGSPVNPEGNSREFTKKLEEKIREIANESFRR
jgi:1-acyl-sn-glycerol-3-phosphate acyltransferase|uniref:1-acyl-sn-glycerol-3-phosphate acyltransferase n=1 Tax=candidate division WOR-3 bacterium TaxID=2052148 RepID=A0A7C3YPR5_UNCW3